LVVYYYPYHVGVFFFFFSGRFIFFLGGARPPPTTLNHQHLATIAASPGWVADDQVKINLARNPRLPETLVEPLLSSMNVNQLRIVAGAVSTSPKARRVAHRILYTRRA